MEKEVVSNSSSLIFLAKLDIFNLAKNVFPKIIIPKKVIQELFEKDSPENELIRRELNKFLFENEVINIKELSLGEGEKEAISLCLEKKINLFLSDDKKARNYAKSLGLDVIGVLGILLYNLRERKVNKKEFLIKLNKLVDIGYYISPNLYVEIIKIIDDI